MPEYQPIGKIGENRTLKVSIRGAAFYLYLPKDFVEVHDLMAGDMVECKLERIFRPEKHAGGKG